MSDIYENLDIIEQTLQNGIKLVAWRTYYFDDCNKYVAHTIIAYQNKKELFKDRVAYEDKTKLQSGKRISSEGALADYQEYYDNDDERETRYCGVVFDLEEEITKQIKLNNISSLDYMNFRTDLINHILHKEYKKLQ